ncbi:MAG: AAA-like domain protein [Deltaproteobacteria bacterium ADurb.Bin135]|nr:MAG: AAA-like domain protein [Deltaproteobacteria bacterium ADurb.Bin135]
MHFAVDNLSVSNYQHYINGIFNLLVRFLELAAILLAAIIVLTIIIKLIRLIRHLREPFLFLEITPPVETKVPNASTTHLFNLIMGLLEQRGLMDRLLLRDSSASFELVSTKTGGVRYLVRIPARHSNNLEKLLRSYLPGSKIKNADDYMLDISKAKVLDFHFTRHFSLPLAAHDDLKTHDPLNYLTGNLGNLKEDELLAVQMVLQPLNHSGKYGLKQESSRIRKVLHRNKNIDWSLNTMLQKYLYAFARIIEAATRIVMIPFFFAAEFLTGDSPQFAPMPVNAKEPTPRDMEYSELAKAKLSEPLFVAGIRVLISSPNSSEKEKGIKTAISSFRHTTGQTLVSDNNLLARMLKPLNNWIFRNRLNGNLVITPSEAGGLYHFPFMDEAYNEDSPKVKSRELPAPLSFKSDKRAFDMIAGVNRYGGKEIELGLTLEQRRKHTYVIGKTGTGKTTMLINAIYQDMANGKGVAVFDPHGDMFRELLGMIPENRLDDVVVFDSSDRNYPIGVNILAPGIKFENKDDEDEWIVSSVLSIFAKMTAKEYWGPRMEHILRNTTLTALQTENPSLYTLQRLLTDKSFQKKTAATLDDPVLKQFWSKEFSLLGKMQLSNAVAPLTQRLGSFITSKMSRHILLQEKSTISISNIMDEGKILLVNLSKGDIGEDHSFFFGSILTSFIWMAAYQRTKIPENKRRDFFLYVDEFQNFATPRFSEITSEGRKFRIGLIASHQNIAQVEDQSILKVVAGNANTIICLKASPDEEKFILPFMEPEVEKGDIVNLAPYHFYMKVSNEASENAFSGVTVPLDISPSDEVEKAVLAHSREKYATSRDEVDEYLEMIFTGMVKKKKEPTAKSKNIQEKLIDESPASVLKHVRKSI